ncbi:uncharacterized protein LOC124620177 [Schistocerca americana]|uniref:uncharacterized protein LOC124620177 n=1 Tax=Schistocerca americana TaxID=7009 RepID=UPI001F4F4E47|nr:uncharacterized protein LOC124620177 [Schistocerca americana]
MRELVEDLNYDFNYNMFILKNALRSLPKHDSRPLALQWLHKLSSCNKTLEDLKLRNEFMYHMVNGLRAGELCPPFDSPPPDVPLTCMAHMLPPEPLVQALSPDGGAFLANQPMPRCGAFCYIAVLCKRSS